MKQLTYLEENVKPVWDEDYNQKIKAALNKKYISFLENEELLVEASKDKSQVQLKITLRKKDGSVVYPIEAVHIVDAEAHATAPDVADIMFDYVDAYWNEYFTEERDVFVPIDWTKHVCEGVVFYMRGAVQNAHLDAQTNAFLKQHGYGDLV